MKTLAPLISLSLLACATSSSELTTDPGGKADGDRESVAIEIGACPANTGDAYELSRVTVVDQQLIVDVRYAGGCEKHVFAACWDGSFEGNPVQARLRLAHQANGDACDGLASSSLAIDLNTLAAAYRQAYQAIEGTLIVRLDDTSTPFAFEALTGTQLEAAFNFAQRDAFYFSEEDSAPGFVSVTASGAIDEALIRNAIFPAIELEGNVVLELGDASAFLSDLATYDPTDEDFLIDSARAWGRVKALLEANLTELTFVRIGPAAPDGTMAIDAGAYQLVVLGRTADGNVAGFFVVSVET
jgi:hypothetical protein